MEKLFNLISIAVGIVGGFMAKIFGGYDILLATIVLLVILDYVSGILKAIYNKKLSSAVGYKGIIKKVMIFLVIALACAIQAAIADTIPLREVTIVFFVCNEGISLLENAAAIIPIPDRLKEVLLQLRDKDVEKDAN